MENILYIYFFPSILKCISVHICPFNFLILFFLALLQFLPHVEKLDDFKDFLQLHNKLPVALLHLVSEPVFESVDGLPADLQGQGTNRADGTECNQVPEKQVVPQSITKCWSLQRM